MPEITEAKVVLKHPARKADDFNGSVGYKEVALTTGNGIYLLVGKTQAGVPLVKAYLFDRSKGWDLKSASDWVTDHVKIAIDDVSGIEFNEPGLIDHETVLAIDSLTELVDAIRSAYYKENKDAELWVRDVLKGSIIVETNGSMFEIPYSRDATGVVTFDYAQQKAVTIKYVELAQKQTSTNLIWKQLLKVGKWFKQDPATGKPLAIDINSKVIKDVKSAFDAGVVPHVYVPSEHTEMPHQNTGFVKALEIRKNQADPDDNGLWCGIEFTEPNIETLVSHGTIANISAWITPNYVDSRDGSTWSWVLRHAALTNQPVLHLKPFAASDASVEDERYEMEVGQMDKEKEGATLSQQDDLAKKSPEELIAMIGQLSQTNQTLETDLGTAQGEVSRLTGELSTAHQAVEETGKEASVQITELKASVTKQATELHNMRVERCLSALQGRGAYPGVDVPTGFAFSPAVLSAVEPILRGDVEGMKSIKLSVDGAQMGSPTDAVLSILNAVAQAKGGVVELSVKGETFHTPPGETKTEQEVETEKSAAVDSYLSRRGLAPVGANAGQ